MSSLRWPITLILSTPWVVAPSAWATEAPRLASGWPGAAVSTPGPAVLAQQAGLFTRRVGAAHATVSDAGFAAGDAGWTLRLSRWGRRGGIIPMQLVAPTWAVHGSHRTVTLVHTGLIESWSAVPSGLEHSWTVLEPPLGPGPVRWQLELAGIASVTVDSRGGGARLVDASGQAWRYDGLRAWDASGLPLPVTLGVRSDGLWVEVDDSDATYPVTVDPLVRLDSKIVPSDALAGDEFAFALSGAGDVNGDGYDDLVVGSKRDDDLGAESGSVSVYLGSATGIDLTTELKFSGSDTVAFDNFGYAAAGAGDVNGDGYDDIVVGIRFDGGGVGSAPGAVYLYLGSAAGIDPTTEVKLVASDGVADDYFGMAAAGAGDVNADGYDDLIVGARWDNTLGAEAGAAYVYLGGPAGIDPTTELKLLASDGVAGDLFGLPVITAGDVDGDGFDDVIVGAHEVDGAGVDTGAAYVFLGSASGIDSGSEIRLEASDGVAGELFGWPVSPAGDVDGDGFGDVVIGANFDDDLGIWSGSAYVFYGDATGIDASRQIKLLALDGAAEDHFGKGVTAADLDADGYSDVVVGSFKDDERGVNSGAAYVFPGGPAGVDPTDQHKLLAADATAFDWFGWWMADAGDVDGDGFGDLVVSASGDGPAKRGAAYMFFGGVRPRVEASGVCPGVVSLQITGASSGGEVALFTAVAPGSSVVSVGPCAGALTALATPIRFRAVTTADALGDASFAPNVPAAECGTVVQALDLSTCTLTDVVDL